MEVICIYVACARSNSYSTINDCISLYGPSNNPCEYDGGGQKPSLVSVAVLLTLCMLDLKLFYIK